MKDNIIQNIVNDSLAISQSADLLENVVFCNVCVQPG